MPWAGVPLRCWADGREGRLRALQLPQQPAHALAEAGPALPDWLPGPPHLVRLYAARHRSRDTHAVLAYTGQRRASRHGQSHPPSSMWPVLTTDLPIMLAKTLWSPAQPHLIPGPSFTTRLPSCSPTCSTSVPNPARSHLCLRFFLCFSSGAPAFGMLASSSGGPSAPLLPAPALFPAATKRALA